MQVCVGECVHAGVGVCGNVHADGGVQECAGVCMQVCRECVRAGVGVQVCVHAVVGGAGVCSCRGQRRPSGGVFNYS